MVLRAAVASVQYHQVFANLPQHLLVVCLAVFVSPVLITQTESAVEETLTNSSWLDVSTVLPPSLGTADVAQMLSKCTLLTKDVEQKKGQVRCTGSNKVKSSILLKTCCTYVKTLWLLM